jgi:hypothetical protein
MAGQQSKLHKPGLAFHGNTNRRFVILANNEIPSQWPYRSGVNKGHSGYFTPSFRGISFLSRLLPPPQIFKGQLFQLAFRMEIQINYISFCHSLCVQDNAL